MAACGKLNTNRPCCSCCSCCSLMARLGVVQYPLNNSSPTWLMFCCSLQAFCRLLGLQVSPIQIIRAEDLVNPPFPFTPYNPPLSNVTVHQKRPYFGDRKWTDTDIGYLSFFVAMHATALVAGPLTFSWDALQMAVAGYVLTGMFGVSMSYHRQLSHKSFRCPKWLEYSLAYCGALAFEGDPVEWSKNHRWHHMHSDSQTDRHSPRDGLWHSHMGWLFDESLTNTRWGGLGPCVFGIMCV